MFSWGAQYKIDKLLRVKQNWGAQYHTLDFTGAYVFNDIKYLIIHILFSEMIWKLNIWQFEYYLIHKSLYMAENVKRFKKSCI